MPTPGACLAGLVGRVNANPVVGYAPGELLVVGRADVKACRPGWNLVRPGRDRGPDFPVEDAAGNPIFPAAYLDPAAVRDARVDRSEWADEGDAPHVLSFPGKD